MNAVFAPRHVLRPMSGADIETVMAIEVRCYSHPWTRGNFADSLAGLYSAEVLTTPSGDLLAYFVAMPGVEEMHLLNIAVAPAWQRQGLASTLLHSLHNQALARALPTLWLEVRASNRAARALYARHGYSEVTLRRAYYPAAHGPREDAVVMRNRLLDAAPTSPEVRLGLV